ncbi:MAG TPA: SDR family oxidoreductase [Steroidobacteraceae bacterium]|nr:SDR family oxidoreductase [Steroidobacteraceae bacterium]
MTTSKTVFGPRLLEGKVAFVAGGTRGMNLAIAKRYAEHGARVAVASRDPERCQAAADEISALGSPALGIPLDVRDPKLVADALEQTVQAFGGLDIVVAGQAGNFFAPATSISPNGFRAVIEVDLLGTYNLFRLAWDHLRRPGASLLAITAPQAVRPMPTQAHACAAKAGINMLLRVLALEWGPAGVRVNGISPGPIEGTVGMDKATAGDPRIIEQVRRGVPLRRWGRQDDIADAALFLASDAASFVTGTILDVDGGVTHNDSRVPVEEPAPRT